MEGEDTWKVGVVGLAQRKGNNLQQEPKQVNLTFFYLAYAGNAIYLLEVQNGIDIEIVIFFFDIVHGEISLSSDEQILCSMGNIIHVKAIDYAHVLLHSLVTYFIEVFLAYSLKIIIDFLFSCVFCTFGIILVLRSSLIDLNDVVVVDGILIRRITVLPFFIEKLFMWFLAYV